MPGMKSADVHAWSFIDEAAIRANSGGPASRKRTEHVCATMLRAEAREIRLPQAMRAGLLFGDRDPLDTVLECLARAGYDDAERLRQCFEAPAASLLVRVVPDARWAVQVTCASDAAILEQALLLGLCTPFQYDPARPVLWTRASLTRRVELYLPAGFHA
jgi:hypothetical protein